jgi:hypothetical protein
MTQVTTALASLLPVAGAVVLTVQGLRRMTRARDPAAPAAPPQAKEPVAAVPGRRKPLPDGVCTSCGTAVPPRKALCTACERKEAGMEFSLRTMAAHWIVFIAVMTAIIGIGWLASP